MANPRDHIPSTDPTEDGDWFDRLSDEQKDAALEHMVACIAAHDSKLLDPQNDSNLIAEIARSGAPNAATIFVRHTQKRPDQKQPDRDALGKCIRQRPRAPIGPLIHAARKCGANLKPWSLNTPQNDTSEPQPSGGTHSNTATRGGAAAKKRSDELPYTGPPVAVPDLGPDGLDEHGVSVGEEPSLDSDHDESTPAPADEPPLGANRN